MSINRRGLGKGRGKGYRNIIFRDKKVHSDSGKGKRQPQRYQQALPETFAKTKTILKVTEHDQNEYLIAEQVEANDLIRKRFPNYPKMMSLKSNGDIMLVSDVTGKPIDIPIRLLGKDQKKQLASVIKYLFQNGHLVSDLKPEMVYIDKDDNAIIADLSGLALYDSRDPQQMRQAEREYNFVILSIFGRSDSRQARHYLTMPMTELGY